MNECKVIMRKLSIISLLLTTLCSWLPNAYAQSFPSSVAAAPVSDDIPGHRWSHRQGLDFDIIDFKTSDGQGVHMYVGVSPKTKSAFTQFISGVWMGKPVKLFKSCDGALCRYNTLLNSNITRNGQELWVQVWINTPVDQTDTYLDWLNSLTFIENPSAK